MGSSVRGFSDTGTQPGRGLVTRALLTRPSGPCMLPRAFVEGLLLDKLFAPNFWRACARASSASPVSFSSVVVAGAAPRVLFAGVSSKGGEGRRLVVAARGLGGVHGLRRLRWRGCRVLSSRRATRRAGRSLHSAKTTPIYRRTVTVQSPRGVISLTNLNFLPFGRRFGGCCSFAGATFEATGSQGFGGYYMKIIVRALRGF